MDHEDLCHICKNPQRNNEQICVVEEATDIIGMESSGVFLGKYHVLQGAISPLDGILPEDLRINELVDKIKTEDGVCKVKEVILALGSDLEGDTTALYLAKLLSSKGVRVTRLAHGVPLGSDIDYIDHRTLGRALENRVEM
jgi:recombination protein RecR